MPLPKDEAMVKTATDVVSAFRTVFGNPPENGFRPAHAKGILLQGTFTPTPEASTLSNAQHFAGPPTPIVVRFSNSTGIPNIPDQDPNASPRGVAIRFDLGPHKHTDIIAHSVPFFPTRTAGEFLEFLNALIASPPGTPSPSPIEKFIGSHPAALAFVTAPKPTPTSLAKEEYFSVSPYLLVAGNGKKTAIKYIISPVLGKEAANIETLKDRSPTFLHEELAERLDSGPSEFKLKVQVGEEGDVTNDATVHWPESRKVVELGSIKIEKLMRNGAAEQKQIIFDPIPRIDGVEESDDPLLEMRAAIYVIGGKQRRAAP